MYMYSDITSIDEHFRPYSSSSLTSSAARTAKNETKKQANKLTLRSQHKSNYKWHDLHVKENNADSLSQPLAVS